MAGALIAVEGIDGSGLSTHSKLLVKSLESLGLRSVYTKEPTEGPVGKLIRSLLSTKGPDPYLMALLFAADRAWHLRGDESLPGGRGVLGALELSYVVVTDRYKYSSIAYQGSAGAPKEWLWSLNSFAREADAIVYIDVPVRLALSRIAARRAVEAYENEAFLMKVKESFAEILERASEAGVKVIRVPGSVGEEPRPVEDVSKDVLTGVLGWLQETRRLNFKS